MGLFIDKHFSAIGGFSTRRNTSEFITVLPYSDLAEAEIILQDFVEDFREQGIRDISRGARKRAVNDTCVEFTILAGIALGQPIEEIDPTIRLAEQQQKEIARLQCHGRR